MGRQVIPVFLSSTADLLGFDGARPYRVVGDALDRAVLVGELDRNRREPYLFLQVASATGGAWWLPAWTVADPLWEGGAEELRARGLIQARGFLRPRSLLWWIPADTLEPTVSVVEVPGEVIGRFPDAAPPDGR